MGLSGGGGVVVIVLHLSALPAWVCRTCSPCCTLRTSSRTSCGARPCSPTGTVPASQGRWIASGRGGLPGSGPVNVSLKTGEGMAAAMASRGDRNHIKNAQFAVLTAQTVFSTGFLAVGGLFATISESGAWLGTLLGALGGLAVAGLCSLVVQMHPGKNLSGIADAVLPKAISKLVSLSYAAYCVWLLAAGTRQFILAIWIPFLQTASPLTLAILVAAVTLYGANLGIEAIARASIVFFPVVVLSILVLAGLSVPVAAPGRLLPAVGVGVPELLRTSLLASSFGAECIVMMAFVAHTNEPEGVGRGVWGSVGMG